MNDPAFEHPKIEKNDPEVLCGRNVTAIFIHTSSLQSSGPLLSSPSSLKICSCWIPAPRWPGNIGGVSRNQRWARPCCCAKQPHAEGMLGLRALGSRLLPTCGLLTPRCGHLSFSSVLRLGGTLVPCACHLLATRSLCARTPGSEPPALGGPQPDRASG